MSLTADIALATPRQSATRQAANGRHAVTVTADLAALADEWRAMLADGVATPYQNPAWIEAYAGSVARAAGNAVLAVAVRDQAGRLDAVLPLEIIRRHGCRIAQVVGGKHANYQMPAMRRSFAAQVTATDWHDILVEAANGSGALDAFAVRHQPDQWAGLPNALASLQAQPSPSPAYALRLDPSGDATLQRSLSAHARKKIRSKRNRFFELGLSSQWQALDDRQIERVLATFQTQKAQRFAALGLPDPFAVPGMDDFFRNAARNSAIELHALELDGEIVSCYIGAVHDGHFSGMATSFAPREDLARMSPGEILLVDLIHALCLRGFTMFDLGVGEARYKATICDEMQRLSDSLIPITARGWLWCQVMRRADQMKRTIKESPRLMALVARLRRTVAGRADQAET